MEKTGKVVAWICIFSTLLMGCYSSTLVDLYGGGERRVSSDSIEWVGRRSGTRYHLTVPPTFVKDTLVIGLRGSEGVKMHLDEISYVITKDGTKHMFDGQLSIANDTIVMRPRVDEKDEIYSGRIEYVVMKDRTKYECDTPPIASDSAIVYNPSVSIPLSDVVQYSSGGKKGSLYMDSLKSVVTKDGTKFEFATPPKISHETLVGVAVNKYVSIPLSDVAMVHVSRFSYVKTALLVVAFLGLAMADTNPGGFPGSFIP
jgi:hypothetical protein